MNCRPAAVLVFAGLAAMVLLPTFLFIASAIVAVFWPALLVVGALVWAVAAVLPKPSVAAGPPVWEIEVGRKRLHVQADTEPEALRALIQAGEDIKKIRSSRRVA